MRARIRLFPIEEGSVVLILGSIYRVNLSEISDQGEFEPALGGPR
jgi:hypothetical protein